MAGRAATTGSSQARAPGRSYHAQRDQEELPCHYPPMPLQVKENSRCVCEDDLDQAPVRTSQGDIGRRPKVGSRHGHARRKDASCVFSRAEVGCIKGQLGHLMWPEHWHGPSGVKSGTGGH
jgi:hypothetical protein